MSMEWPELIKLRPDERAPLLGNDCGHLFVMRAKVRGGTQQLEATHLLRSRIPGSALRGLESGGNHTWVTGA